MISPKVKANKTIIYSKGDSFNLPVSRDEGFHDGTTLEIVIAEEERQDALISKKFSMNSDGTFSVVLTSEIKKLDYGEYVYKLIFSLNNEVITQHSGILEVRWSA